MTTPSRRVLLVTHASRLEAQELAAAVATRLLSFGIGVCAPESDLVGTPLASVEGVGAVDETSHDIGCELVCVLGGDGTILRGAEISRGLGGAPARGQPRSRRLPRRGRARGPRRHRRADLLARDYTVEERMTLEVRAGRNGDPVFTSWALNEVTVEKASRERMLELTVEIDGRPLSTWGCDGVVMATPTGSTAYAFSAGGPVVWPDVEALLLVPISAHALFARPARRRPAVPPVRRSCSPDAESSAVLWCDGRRAVTLPPGAQVEVERSELPVRLARLSDAVFTDRLVEKFDLPVYGWRGAARQRAAAEDSER